MCNNSKGSNWLNANLITCLQVSSSKVLSGRTGLWPPQGKPGRWPQYRWQCSCSWGSGRTQCYCFLFPISPSNSSAIQRRRGWLSTRHITEAKLTSSLSQSGHRHMKHVASILVSWISICIEQVFTLKSEVTLGATRQKVTQPIISNRDRASEIALLGTGVHNKRTLAPPRSQRATYRSKHSRRYAAAHATWSKHHGTVADIDCLHMLWPIVLRDRRVT